MHRSASWSRASEYYLSANAASPAMRRSTSFEEDDDRLPLYDPATEKERDKSRDKFAEKAVHVIPFVLLACALVLWFFSNPEVGLKADQNAAAKVEGLTLEGGIDHDGDGTQTGFLPMNLDQTKGVKPKGQQHTRRN